MQSNKKVLIITYYWPPAGGIGVQRWLYLSKYLLKSGITPIILTVDAQYASYPIIDTNLNEEVAEELSVYTTKSFEILSLYKKISKKGELPHGGFDNGDKISFFSKIMHFIRGNFFIPDPRRGWNKYAKRKALQLIEKYKIDTVVTTSPPHSSQLIGLYLKEKCKINWIADLRDPWTDIFYYKSFKHTRLAACMDKSYEKKVLSKADKVLVTSEATAALFATKLKGISEGKIQVITNGYEDKLFENKPVLHSNRIVVSYVGTISGEYPVDAIVNAIADLIAQDFPIYVRFIGSVAPEVKTAFSKLGSHVEYIGRVSHREAIAYMLKSSVLLLLMHQSEDNKGVIIPGKLFEYLATERSILYVGPMGSDAAKIIDECEAGVCCDYNDKEGMRDFLLKQCRSENRRPVSTGKYKKYSRENLAKKYAELIHSME